MWIFLAKLMSLAIILVTAYIDASGKRAISASQQLENELKIQHEILKAQLKATQAEREAERAQCRYQRCFIATAPVVIGWLLLPHSLNVAVYLVWVFAAFVVGSPDLQTLFNFNRVARALRDILQSAERNISRHVDQRKPKVIRKPEPQKETNKKFPRAA